MQKVLTAIGSLELNERLKKIKDFKVFEKDIQYKEAIIDVLKIEKDFDVIIINEDLPGEMKIEQLIKNIKFINSEIKIFFILKNKDEDMEKTLYNENVKKIFYNDEIKFEEFVKEIKDSNISREEILLKEINDLKKVIVNKDDELSKYKKGIKNNKGDLREIIANKNNELVKYKKDIKNNKKVIQNKVIIITQLNEKIIEKWLNSKRNVYIFNLYNINKKIKYATKIFIIIDCNFDSIRNITKILQNMKSRYFVKIKRINFIFIQQGEYQINYKILKNYFKDYNLLGKIKVRNNKYIINKKIKGELNGISIRK